MSYATYKFAFESLLINYAHFSQTRNPGNKFKLSFFVGFAKSVFHLVIGIPTFTAFIIMRLITRLLLLFHSAQQVRQRFKKTHLHKIIIIISTTRPRSDRELLKIRVNFFLSFEFLIFFIMKFFILVMCITINNSS